MRVFSVEMLVKEEGAATVQAALNRLKKETQAVADEMKKTTQSVTNTGRAMQEAGSKTEIAKDRAAKAAIGFAAVGNSLARTGTITADVGTKIIESGSQIAMMFGPKGLAVAALLGFATAALTSFGKASTEAKKMEEDFNKSLGNIVNQGDIIALTKQLRDLELGVPSGALDSIVDASDGIRAMRTRIQELEATGFTAFNKANRDELNRLTTALKTAESNAKSLRNAILNASRPLGEPIAAPITITAPSQAAAITARVAPKLASLPIQVPAEVLGKVTRDFSDLLTVKIPDALAPAVADLSGTIYGQLAQGISASISGGITSGLQMALASGNIGEAFRAMGQAIVSSLANAMVNVALAAIQFGTLMEKIRVFMMANPALAVVSAIALLTLARAIGGSAHGARMGAIGTAGGLSYSAMGSATTAPTQLIFGSTSATTAAGMTPRSSMNVTVIGPNDPSAQRAIQELMMKADSRGRVG